MNRILLIAGLFMGNLSAFSQNVGINTTGVAGHASAMLDVEASDKGVLIPRVSIGNVSLPAPVASPATGLLVYNTNVATTGGLGVGYYYWTGTAWAKLLSSNAGVLSIAGTANQVLVANSGGNYTLSTPQDIHTGANTVFNSVTAPNDFFGRINIEDTRSTNALPATYSREVHFEFKDRSAISAPGAGTYGGLMTMAPWSDASGGSNHQLFFNDGGIFYRTGAAGSAWNGWGELVTSGSNKHWTMSAQMNFSPDDYGVTSLFIDNTDDARSVQTLPFAVVIEGVSYTQITICTNGWIAFGDVNSTTFSATAIPASFTNNPVIFPFWTDLMDYGAGEYISVRSEGTAPNRVYHIRYRMRGRCTSTTLVAEFQVQIHEGSNLINVKYNTMNPSLNGQQWTCDGTKNTTIGFQLHGGANAKTFPISYNSKVLDDNAANTEGFSVCPVK
jgi:hypothetical protein